MAKIEPQSSNSFGPAVLIAVWMLVLLAAFFYSRGDDVGKLGQLVGNLGGGPVVGMGIFDSLIGAVVAMLIAASWFGLGSLITSFIPASRADHHSHILELSIKTAVGAAAWSLIWFFLGLFGAYGTIAALAALIVGFITTLGGMKRLREAKDESRVPPKAAGFDTALLVLVALPLALSFIASLAPPTAKDTLLYHFALPKAFVAQGGNAFVEGNIASFLALGTEMHTVWGMLLGGLFSQRAGEAAGGAVIWMFFPLLAAAIYGWARELGIERRLALIASAMVVTVPTVYHVAASAYIDIALTLFIMLAVYSLTRWWRNTETGWALLVAIFLGAALSAKLTTLFVIAGFALIVMLRVRAAQATDPDRIGRIAATGFAALVLAGVIASPWYLRTWVETGSPIFPFYMNIWPGEAAGWDAERSNLFQLMNAQYGGVNKSAIDQINTPVRVSLFAQPELAEDYDGVLGPVFLFGVPLLLIALWKFELSAEVKIAAGLALIMYVFWLSSSQQLRYLIPLLPLLAIGTTASIAVIGRSRRTFVRVSTYTLAAAAFAVLIVSAAWFLQKAPVRAVLGGETKDQYLARNIDYFPYYQWLNNESGKDSKVWLINMRRDTYNLDRPYLSDYLFEDWTLRQIVWESKSSQELRAKASSLGVQYILTRHDFLFDYARSPIVDDQRPRAENEAKLQMARALLLDPARTVKADNKFSLVRVF